MGRNRGATHVELHQAIADLSTEIRPTLTLVDATRVLVRHGPQGGNLDDVRAPGLLIAGTDPVAVDCYAARLPVFGLADHELPDFIEKAHRLGVGEMKPDKIKITKKRA